MQRNNEEIKKQGAKTKIIRIIGTSDLHGKFVPWDYALNEKSPSGSIAQLSSAVKEYRTENTLLMDGGDSIQDNSAEIFVRDNDVHPMIQGINALNYDVWVTGNHDYNFGMDVLKKTITDLKCSVLTGNVYDTDGKPIADGYTFFTVDGIRVAVIGMVTPIIAKWDAQNLQGCRVSDPLKETRKIIDEIQGQYDVLIGVYHMGINNEFGVPGSGVGDILKECPEFDVMISGHTHMKVAGKMINGILTVQNQDKAKTMAVIDLTLTEENGRWKVTDRKSESVDIAGYQPDPDILELLEKYDRKAREDAETVIGRVEGEALAPDYRQGKIPAARLQDTALMDLVNHTQMYYAGTAVSASPLFASDANLYPGEIRKCDMAKIYQYTNTLYKVHMTGSQLKKYMERSAGYFIYNPAERMISVNKKIPDFLYQLFEGVNYEINLSQPVGSRIENLTWPDGIPVKDDDECDIAVNNYSAVSEILIPGTVYEENDMPVLLDSDIRSDIGGIRELIRDYIINVKKGLVTHEVNNNWKITGIG